MHTSDLLHTIRRPLRAGAAMALFLLFAAIPLAPLTAQVTFKVDAARVDSFPRIRIPVSVIDNSALIRTLSASDFTVLENGRVMAPLSLDCETMVLDDTVNIMFVIDVSTSMAFKEGTRYYDPDSVKWRKAKQVMSSAFHRLRPFDRGALMSFSEFIVLRQGFTSDISSLDRALVRLRLNSGTSFFDAIIEAVSLSQNLSGKTVIIVLTDGEDSTSSTYLIDAIRAAKSANLPVYSIGLGVEQNYVSTLDSLSRQTGGESFYAPTSQELDDVFTRIFNSIYRSTCILSYTSPDTCQAGELRTVDVSVTFAGSTLSERSLYGVRDLRSRASIGITVDAQIDDDLDHDIPVAISGELRAGEATDYDVDILYDPALWEYQSVVTTGTLLDGTVLTATEPVSGTIHVQGRGVMPRSGVPYGASETLFFLRLHARHQNKLITTSIDVRNLWVRQNCDVLSTSSGSSLVINGCLALERCELSSPAVVANGAVFRVPLILHDAIDKAQPLRFTSAVRFDTSRIAYVGVSTTGTIASTLTVDAVERTPGVIDLVIDGPAPQDSIGVLCVFVFRSRPSQTAGVTDIRLERPVLVQSCLPAVQAIASPILLDGYCERTIERIAGPRLLPPAPNPATSRLASTTLRYDLTDAGRTVVEMWDASGRLVSVLVDADLPAGRHETRFDCSGLPGGTYLCVLRQGSVVDLQTVIWAP